MVIIQIEAGMGNQMFMYAAGLATAHRLYTELFLDTSSSPKTGKNSDMMNRLNRPYCLDCFPNITEQEATLKNTKKCPFPLKLNVFIHRKRIRRRSLFRRLIYWVISTFELNYYSHIKRGFSYNPEFEKLPDNIWLWDIGNLNNILNKLPT